MAAVCSSSYELRVASWELRVTSYELELRVRRGAVALLTRLPLCLYVIMRIARGLIAT
jgi:hypothetical protein